MRSRSTVKPPPGLLTPDPYWLARGLVAAYPMAEGVGGPPVDIVTRERSAFSSAPRWAAGPRGAVLDFDGTDDYLDLGASSRFDLGGTAGPFSITGWVRRDVTTEYMVPLARGTGSTPQFNFSWADSDDATPNKLRLQLRTGGANALVYGSTAHTDTAAWHHIALTYDGATLRFYWDGAPDGETAETRTFDSVASSSAAIGRLTHTSAFSDGQIEDVTFFRGPVLTLDEIKYLYETPAGVCRPLPHHRALMLLPVAAETETVTFANPEPEDEAVRVPLDGTLALDVTAVDAGNLVDPDALSFEVEGRTYPATGTVTGALSYRMEAVLVPMPAGRAVTVTAHAATEDATDNTFTWSFTLAGALPSVGDATDFYLVAGFPPVAHLVDYAPLGGQTVAHLADYAGARVDLLAYSSQLTDYAATPELAGLLRYLPHQTDYVGTIFVSETVTRFGGVIAEPHFDRTAFGAEINGTARDRAPFGMVVSGRAFETVGRFGATVGRFTRETAGWFGAVIASPVFDRLPMGARLRDLRRRVALELTIRSQKLQEIDDEP